MDLLRAARRFAFAPPLSLLAAITVPVALAFSAAPSFAADAQAGQSVFATQCSSCHTVKPAQHGFGPSLAGVLGRKAGSADGFGNYTPAMKQSGLTWDAATLDSFLAASTAKVPGTAMAVSVTSAQDRADVIAYLATLGS